MVSVGAAGLSEQQRLLLHRVVRFNTIAIALTIGLTAGLLLWLATAILLLRGGEQVGKHLGLLALFLPNYSVTWSGAMVGLFWGFVVGAASGAMLYLVYARSLRSGARLQYLEPQGGDGLHPPLMLLSGPALGMSLGALGALDVFFATNWLVVRGTAAYSENAALLGQYLPGYTVSFVGSLVGAAQVFAIAFVASLAIAAAYNAVTTRRARR